MRTLSILLVILIVAGNTSAECRDKECMPNNQTFFYYSNPFENMTFHYDSVFTIGSNWFVIIDYGPSTIQHVVSFEFDNGLHKNITLPIVNETAIESISFPGSSFTDEQFHKKLYLNHTVNDGQLVTSAHLEIHVNKPPADDIAYLWGGMTVFWASIGAYVIYLSNKFRELSKKSGLEDG